MVKIQISKMRTMIFFYDEELDDGLYDLTVDFEVERGFRF